MGLSLTGIYTGIDTDTLIARVMAISQQPLLNLQVRQSEWQAKRSAVEEIRSRLTALKSIAERLQDAGELRQTAASSSDTDVLTATGGSGATEGTYSVLVNQLAKAEKEVHNGVAALDDLVGEGQLVYTYGSGEDAVTRTIETTDQTTLEGLRDLINNDAGNPGVTASILEYQADEEHVYHLVLTGNDTGAAMTVAVDDDETTLDGTNGTVDFRSSTFTQTQAGQDAQVRVDGYPPSAWIQRASNTISDVIPGVTLTLHAASADAVTVSLSRDTSTLRADLAALVTTYNQLADVIAEHTGYDADSETGGVLQGDSTLNGLFSIVRRVLVTAATGFDSASDAYTLPAQLGLQLDRYGVLSIDQAARDEALSEDYLAALALIGTSGTGATDDPGLAFTSVGSATRPGVYDVEVDYGPGGEIVQARTRLAGEGGFHIASVIGNVIVGAVNQPEEGLRLTVVSGGVSETIAYQVRVRQGFAGTLYDRLDEILQDDSGPIALKEAQVDKAIEDLSRKIEVQQERLDAQEKRLQAEYARMEAALAQVDALNAGFQSLFTQLAAMTSTANQ